MVKIFVICKFVVIVFFNIVYGLLKKIDGLNNENSIQTLELPAETHFLDLIKDAK